MTDGRDPRHQGMCAERSGFLFSHECTRMASGNCSQCNKEICEEHTFASEEGLLCTTCAKKARRQQQRGGGMGSMGGRYRHDPFFYHGYYHGWGHHGRGHWGHDHVRDENDLTEADGESLQAEADEDFEQDMGGS